MLKRVLVLMLTAAAFTAVVILTFRGRTTVRLPQRPADRVVLLGFDGVSPSVVDALVSRGELPNLKRLMQRGAYGPLRSASPAKSAILWTSIATGKTMLKHGIIDWTYLDRKGIAVPFQDRSRKVKTYWEILAERGVKTGTVNWWVSYPPSPILNGYIVSNAFRHTSEPGTVHPMRLFGRLDPLRVEPPEAASEMEWMGLNRFRKEDAVLPLRHARAILEAYSLYVAQDLTVDRVSDQLWRTEPVDVFSTYFRLTDVTSHFALNFVDKATYQHAAALEQQGKLTPEAEGRIDAAFAQVVAPAYRFMDRIVGKYLERADPRTAIILCSDHGFRFYRGAYAHAHLAMQPPDGVIFLSGPGIKPGSRVEGASLFDIAPTILYLAGQPLPADMDGRLLEAVFLPEALQRSPVRTVSTYERAQRSTAPGSRPEADALDRKVLEDLKTLGYIDGDDQKTP